MKNVYPVKEFIFFFGNIQIRPKMFNSKIDFNITVLRTLFSIPNPVATTILVGCTLFPIGNINFTNPSVAGQVFWCAAPFPRSTEKPSIKKRQHHDLQWHINPIRTTAAAP
jgi:hypothetical protein